MFPCGLGHSLVLGRYLAVIINYIRSDILGVKAHELINLLQSDD